ncbi:MAG: hypothetical protein ACP5R5_14770, partial [Armatimonadota bacterium]
MTTSTLAEAVQISLPASSRPTALMTCRPFATVVVSNSILNGYDSERPIGVPSMSNSTLFGT